MFSEKDDFNSLGYKKYEELDDVEVQNRYEKIIEQWREFLTQNDPTLILDKDYYIHKKNMFEVIRRCDKRYLYYYVFHDLKDICEYKDIALYCFWIITLKPFMVVNPNANIYNCPNEMFALYLILSVIQGAYEEKYTEEFKYPSDERIRDIIYDFKYCSLSREAITSFIETFADTYNVGIQYILNSNKNEE